MYALVILRYQRHIPNPQWTTHDIVTYNEVFTIFLLNNVCLFLFVWGLSSFGEFFTHGDITITSKWLHILTYALAIEQWGFFNVLCKVIEFKFCFHVFSGNQYYFQTLFAHIKPQSVCICVQTNGHVLLDDGNIESRPSLLMTVFVILS